KLANTGLLLEIRGAQPSDTASVYFRKFEGDEGSPETRIKAWRKVFREPAETLKVQSEQKKIAAFPVVYVVMDGTSLRETTPNFMLFAAIVKTKEGHVVVRVSGPRKVVDNSKKIFSEMVERALKERESE
ncbi:MAG: hypothetical protein JWM68_4080, partial [Verrucomicrobiales bacterium]|nr:hypothetical protein [Verrucomicrobiales bacterium]